MCEMIFILPSKWAADYDEHVTGNRIQDSHPIHQPTTLVATCPLSSGRGSWRCWDHQPMLIADNADMVRGRINNSKICDPKTDVKEFYSILGIWWESYQIYYIDGLQNSWGMFSITSNIQHRLQPVPAQDPRIHAGMIKNGVGLIVCFCKIYFDL